MKRSLAYLAGVGAYAMGYEGPCPFQPEDIGYNDYADGWRDAAAGTNYWPDKTMNRMREALS